MPDGETNGLPLYSYMVAQLSPEEIFGKLLFGEIGVPTFGGVGRSHPYIYIYIYLYIHSTLITRKMVKFSKMEEKKVFPWFDFFVLCLKSCLVSVGNF